MICDSEFSYANKLMENILERRELAVKVYICTTWENVKILAREQQIHILIADENVVQRDWKSIGTEQIFILSRTAGNFKDGAEKRVYKYQCADQILTEVFEGYFECTNEMLFREGRRFAPRMIAIYSPIHRAGKTSFAIALGKELGKQRKTLYLNLEEYAGLGSRFEREEGKNLGDVLYYAKQEEANFKMFLNSIIRRIDDLDYIPPILCTSDLKEITKEEWEAFFKQIEENTVYENIIWDFGESVQGLLELLGLCDCIYMPVLEDSISQEKIRQYEENLNQLRMKDLNLKTKRILVPEKIEPYVKNLIKEEC